MRDTPLATELGHHLRDEAHAGRITRRELLRRASVLGLSAPLAATLLAACGGDEQRPGGATEPVRKGGTIRAGAPTPTAAVEPVTMFDAGAIAVVQLVAEYLAWVEPDLRLRPVLAERWQPDATAKRWTFHLRKGVRFSDNRPLEADDVVATFERLVAPDSKSAALSNFAGLLKPGQVEKLDPATVVFHLERPFADFPYLVSSSNYNTVVLPRDYRGDFAERPIGTGPFLLTRMVAGRGASFRRNPGYWRSGLPHLDAAQLTFYSENQAGELALQGAAVDLLVLPPTKGSPLYSDPNVTVATAPSTAYNEFHMRVDTPPWSDKRVRQAMALALDRQGLVAALTDGTAQLGNDHVFAPAFPRSPAADIPQRTQDLERARQLVRDAGVAGARVTLQTQSFLNFPDYASLVQAAAKQIGLEMATKVVPQKEYYGSGDNQPWLTVPAGIVDWAARAIPSQFFSSAFVSGGIWNSAHWRNPEFDRLARDYDATLDVQSRGGIAKRMAALQREEVPAVIAYWVDAARAQRKNVRGVVPDGAAFLDLTSAWLAPGA